MAHDRCHQELPAQSPRKNRWKYVVGGLCAILVCVAIRLNWGDSTSNAEPASAGSSIAIRASQSMASEPAVQSQEAPAQPAPSNAAQGFSVPAIVATVNTQRISRDELARECLHQYGNEDLESMVNKRLIMHELKKRNLTVTPQEVHAEIEQMARRFKIPVEKWLELVKQERNILPQQYANDIIWPTLALRKLAGERLQVTEEEKIREFEAIYGAAVRTRLIVASTQAKADKLRAQAVANPEEFGNLAKQFSEDAPSASAKGIIRPIHKHRWCKEVEDAAFSMADGEISPVIAVEGQFFILKRDGLLPAQRVNYADVAPKIEEVVRDRKLQPVAKEVFRELQKHAKVENIWNDPKRHAEMPDVAALVNGMPISLAELAQACMERHGVEVLEGIINRKLLEDACQKHNITVTEEDMQQEIRREALLRVKPKPDGSPDLDAWWELVTKQREIPQEIYKSQVVWPTVVLRKLVVNSVQITDEDLRKGYEANYGPRVRCLAIVLDNERRAQQVFEMARQDGRRETFGDLAAKYSIDSGSQALRGEIAPIKQHCGHPTLEQEAFSLQPGEVSGVIPVNGKFVLLRCDGRTKPANDIDFAMVRDDIYQDIFEKKLHLEMGKCYETIQDSASVVNYLANTTHEPRQAKPAAQLHTQTPAQRSPASGQAPVSRSQVPTLRPVPIN